MKKTCHSTKEASDTSNVLNGSLRYLGCSHIIGELLRKYITRDTLNLSYALTTSYILADTVNQCNQIYEQNGSVRQVADKAGDVLIFHSCASIFIPGYIVERIKLGTTYWLKHAGASGALRRYLPVAVGLISIPIILKPIDRSVNYLMDETYRKFVN